MLATDPESDLNSSLASPIDTHTPRPRKLDSGIVALRSLRHAAIGANDTTKDFTGTGNTTSTAFPRAGEMILGFNILEKLGEGGFGAVFLAEEVKLGGRLVALKFTSRPNKEPERLASLQHANIVPVYSVHTMPPIQVLCMPYLGRQTLQSVVETVAVTRCKGNTLPLTGSALLSGEPTRPAESKSGSKWKVLSKSKPKSLSRIAPTPQTLPVVGFVQTPQPIRERLHRLSFKESVVWLFTRLAEGLNHAHERGILHLDMKPSNILMTDDGVPMILDFGLAYDTKSGNYDQTGGTPKYMSPEQLVGYAHPGKVVPDARMDLYALGLMFFELITGVHPFEDSSVTGTSIQRMREARKCQPPKVRSLNANVDPAVEAIVLKLLQPNPENRYQSAEDLLTDLVLHQENRPLKFAGNPSVWERVKKMRRRHPILAVAMVAALFAMSTTGAVATAAHEARQRSEAEASLQAKRFQSDLKASRIDLATMDRTEDRKAAIRKAEAALAKYEVQTSPAWISAPNVQHLSAEERKQLGLNLVELSALLAHAHRLNALFEKDSAKAESYERGMYFNALASKLNEGFPHLSGLEIQREELMQLAKLTHETPRGYTGLTEPLDLYLAGLSGMANGHYAKSVEAFKAMLENAPEHGAGQLCLGWVYQYQGQFTDAAERFQLAKVLSPKDPRSAFNRGVLMQFQRKYPAAIEEFNAAIARDPNFATTYYYRALTYRKLGKLEAGVADCGRAIDGKEMVYASHVLRAELYEELLNPTAAKLDRDAVANFQPKSESEFFARGRSKLAKDPAAALEDFNRAIEINPRYLTAWMNKASVLHERLNQPEQALDALDRVIELHPRSTTALANQAVILARMGKKHRALGIVDTLKPWVEDASVWFECARAYALVGERESALSCIRRALREGFTDFKKLANTADFDELKDVVAFHDAVAAAKTLQLK